MKTPDLTEPGTRRRLIAAGAGALIVLHVIGTGIYGLITGPPSHDRDNNTPSDPVVSAPADPAPTAPPRLPVVRASADPESFARNVATSLFAWDTASGFMLLDYTLVILDVGDPTGAEQAGLASDVAAYLPNQQAWIELRQYATAQHLTIDNAFVPDAWDTALEQAQPGQLAEGTVAYTIEGTRHREGLWNDEHVTSAHPVAFTMFIACPPEQNCHLLRLSQLDNPLR
ncbi:hypothetical protein [Nesterenkonia sp. PF2B19]|uniref:hypothetical protein n=1 Tax=Nesterenkonia sp. PF2B19 TaxID=1881858 RepID=UPI00087242F4|nr:hypothetical protein [Nesterenkonia sp. PF2B19]OSM44565.1 hypothetical protein BCY76_001280 [Nesterenkonia sp. PF2B19]